jgi:hypothetical protein
MCPVERFGLTETAGHGELDMRYLAMAAAGVCLLAMNATTGVTPATAAISPEVTAPIVLAQNEPKKSETMKQKVKRVWRNMTGYKFTVGCPALIELSHKTCTETGKSRDDARAKCISANPLCSVTDVK